MLSIISEYHDTIEQHADFEDVREFVNLNLTCTICFSYMLPRYIGEEYCQASWPTTEAPGMRAESQS